MADWNKVRKNVGTAAGKAAKKTGEVVDIASLYVKLKMAQAKLDGYYTALGKLTYKQLKTGESQAERIKPIVDKIDDTQAKMRALGKKIEDEKERRKAQKEQREGVSRIHIEIDSDTGDESEE